MLEPMHNMTIIPTAEFVRMEEDVERHLHNYRTAQGRLKAAEAQINFCKLNSLEHMEKEVAQWKSAAKRLSTRVTRLEAKLLDKKC